MVYCEIEESCTSQRSLGARSLIYDSYMRNNWTLIAESSLPLKASKLATANQGNFEATIEMRSRQISTKVIIVNFSSLFINLLLAIIAFYFSFVNNSSSTTAFAADCVLDFMSSAIVLWRYYGDLSNVCLHAREQIACIYLGVLFEISAFGIIIKSLTDMVSSTNTIIDTDSSAGVSRNDSSTIRWEIYNKTMQQTSQQLSRSCRSTTIQLHATVTNSIVHHTFCTPTIAVKRAGLPSYCGYNCL